MKRYLLIVLLTLATLASVRADLIWYEGFNYADGLITNNSAGVWKIHSSSGVNDAYVRNSRAEISGNTSVNAPRQSDFNRPFCISSCTYTSAPQVVYASFTINCTNLPTAVSNYIAHFMASSTTFHGRVHAMAGTFPGTWRLGISGVSTPVSKVYPADLARDTTYQVVVGWDPVSSFAATLWVNPVSSSDPSVSSIDAVTSPAASTAYGFRQAGGNTSFFANVTNLAVATTFDEAATNIWTTNAVAPIIVTSPQSGTNFLNTPAPVILFGIAAGQGLGNLTYTWLRNGAIYPNPSGNTNALVTAAAPESESGAYQMVATTPYGLSVTSAVANLWITNAPVPPEIFTQPASQTVAAGSAVTLSVGAFGPGTLSYQWIHAGTNLPGEVGSTLLLTNVRTNNGNTGAYRVGVTNENGGVLSSVAVIAATNAPKVSIAYLRTLVDGVNYNATNSSSLWEASGTVTTFTNLTSGNTASYYLQDGTAGINIFVTLGSTFRPAQGDYVTFVGVLSSFSSTLELLADTAGIQGTSYTVVSNNAPLPAPKVIPFGITNNLAVCEALEGRIVMLTNVYFGTNEGATIATGANTTLTVTNAAGETFLLFFSSQDGDTAGQILPGFARSVIGPFTQNLNNTAVPRNQGYSVTVTRFADIVTAGPPPPTLAITRTGNSSTLTWQNVAWDNVNYSYGSNYSYSVLAAQPSYQAALSGSGEFPANASTATGIGRVVVSPDGSKITVNMSFSGLTGGNATAAHIHGPAGVGTNTSVLFGFSGVPAATSGSIPEQTFALSPTQAGYLHNGLLYMNVHNATFPGGEIRDQLRWTPPDVTGPYVVQSNFRATPMLGVNEVPANGSTATGSGTVVLSPDQTTITVNMSFSGLTGGPATAAHIHGPAGAGTNASVLFPFSGVPAATSGSIPEQSFAITPAQVTNLQTGVLYMNVHNATFTGGEIRAQLLLVPSTGLTSANTSLTNTTATTSSYTDPTPGAQQFYKVTSP